MLECYHMLFTKDKGEFCRHWSKSRVSYLMIIFLICTPWADTAIFEEIWLKNQIQFLMKLNGPIRGFTKKGLFIRMTCARGRMNPRQRFSWEIYFRVNSQSDWLAHDNVRRGEKLRHTLGKKKRLNLIPVLSCRIWQRLDDWASP